MLRQYELVARVKSYNPNADEGLINRAYIFSMKTRTLQGQAPGDPFYVQSLEVAGILADLHLDDESIVTALMHDTIAEFGAKSEEIKKRFGQTIATLVEGVTKLSQLEAIIESDPSVANVRDSLGTIPDDLRVLLVRLANRLQNLRVLHLVPDEEKRRRFARDTMEIYVPFAERVGLYGMMQEMQTLAFRELEPAAYSAISRRLDHLQEEEGEIIQRIGDGIQAHLAAYDVLAEVQQRKKQPYSVWRKMAEQHVSFEQLSDAVAFRVVVGSRDEAYRALGLIHQRWPMVPGRFKDFISTPKRNGYRALHTTMIHNEQMRIQIQILTQEMDVRAQHGFAADTDSKYSWTGDLIEVLEYYEPAGSVDPEETGAGWASAPISSGVAERILRTAASPQIVAKDSQFDAANSEFEVDNGVPLEWLPRHLRECARMLHEGISENAPNLLRTPLSVYYRAVDENPYSPIIQTLVFSASMIKIAMSDADFDFWANGLRQNFEAFLDDHQRLVDHYPLLEARQAALFELPVDFSADIGSALSEFVASSRKVLDILVESGVTTDKARGVLQQQLDLAQSIVSALPAFASEDPNRDQQEPWTAIHDQAANNLGVWIQVRDNLGFALSLSSQPQLQHAMSVLIPAISKFIEAFIFLAK